MAADLVRDARLIRHEDGDVAVAACRADLDRARCQVQSHAPVTARRVYVFGPRVRRGHVAITGPHTEITENAGGLDAAIARCQSRSRSEEHTSELQSRS